MSAITARNDARKLTLGQAMVEGIRQEMERDSRVFCIGEDIGKIGGVFQSTAGLQARFGPDRVRDTPISETGLLGIALGAAVRGMRPIAELMFVDFAGVCFDQILNNISKTTYMSGGAVKVPLVVTASMGAGICDAAQHSQSLHGLFAHIPGLKVAIPSTPYDAKGLITTAIRDDNPVVYLFHRSLLGLPIMSYLETSIAEEVPVEPYAIPFGKARKIRDGHDVTIVGVAHMVHKAALAAQQLEQQGICAEVIDLRTLVPMDVQSIAASVGKTGRLLVVDEDYLNFGMSGEIVACIAERLDTIHLKAPVRRLAVPGIPIPYSRALEIAAVPQIDTIVQAAMELMGGKSSTAYSISMRQRD